MTGVIKFHIERVKIGGPSLHGFLGFVTNEWLGRLKNHRQRYLQEVILIGICNNVI